MAQENFMEFMTPGQAKEMGRLSGELAALPETELAYEWLNREMPQGQQLDGYMGGVYVPPSITQNLAAAYRQQQGMNMVRDRGDKASQLAQMISEALAKKQMQGQQSRGITPSQAQAKPVEMGMTTTQPLARSGPQFPGMMPTGNRKPIGLEEDIFEVSMPYGGLGY